ncbi:unnamed protein product [Bursaphelenchus xylophilus]|uniref:Palmitoyltransferase n=1 Tax=Bursaphelenchus xylophilus TaxID=6326 RepID=A0A1I7SE74_BURXY|nr:unnamed protein product [Bursaphelenchus xylophilus]CAG9088615.1 unnamed protein product [Bursaphelenchus xylophilus]
MWIQPFLWFISFLIWYQLFTTVFLTFLLFEHWTYVALFYSTYVVLFCLSLGSLFQALFAPMPKIPEGYRLPEGFFEAAQKNQKLSPEWARGYLAVRALARNRKLKNSRKRSLKIERKTLKFPLFCLKCNIIKPKDTRHCTRCSACIPRLDHHCPAMGKCVHYGNHKHFLLFLIYAVVICVYTDIVAGFHTVKAIMRYQDEQIEQLLTPIMLAATGLVQTMSFPPVLIWFQYGLWENVLDGLLTVETCYESNDSELQKTEKTKLENIKNFFGENYWLWPWPITTETEERAFE